MRVPPVPTLGYQPARAARRARWRRVVLVTLIVGVVGAVCVVGARAFLLHAFKGTDTESLNPAQIERWANFKLPPSASNVRAHLAGWQDHTLRVRFDLTAAELPAFLDSTGIRRPLSTNPADIDDEFHSAGPNPKLWWNPGVPAKFETGEGEFDDPDGPTIYQRILIDRSNPTTWTVWFIAFDT
jgi:hypothetical protein